MVKVALLTALCAAAFFVLAHAGEPLAAGDQAPYPISSPSPSYSHHWANRISQSPPTCVRLTYSVSKDGRPTNIEVWSHYPSDTLDKVAANALARWRFHPAMRAGQPVVSGPEFQEFVYDRSTAQLMQQLLRISSSFSLPMMIVGGRNGVEPHSANPNLAALIWLCRQPASHRVVLLPAPSATIRSGADSTAAQLHAVNPSIRIKRSLVPVPGATGAIPIRFCVDKDGRVENTVVPKRLNGALGSVARTALEQTAFLPLIVGNSPQGLCGLQAKVVLYERGPLTKHRLGEILLTRYDADDRGPRPPKFLAARRVQLSLRIPQGIALPPVARVEVRFCIKKDGSVIDPTIIHADPKKYFDQAALQTVRGWHFASSSREVCDVYQSVEFPLSPQQHQGS